MLVSMKKRVVTLPFPIFFAVPIFFGMLVVAKTTPLFPILA